MKLAHEPVAAKAVKQRLEARHVRALASKCDPVRHDFELGLADRMDAEARSILIPPKPLQMGLGGEIVPSVEDGLPGLESALQEPDLLNAEASKQRALLLERAGVLELGVEVAEEIKATDAIEKMVAHQMAAGHKRALELLAESASTQDADIAIMKSRAAARLIDAFSRSALTLQRLRTGASQIVQVQHIQVVGQALIGQVGGMTEKVQNQPAHSSAAKPQKNRGGRPPTNGYRTKAEATQRQADRRLIDSLRSV
jgi:hypothetical protein